MNQKIPMILSKEPGNSCVQGMNQKTMTEPKTMNEPENDDDNIKMLIFAGFSISRRTHIFRGS